MFDWIFNQYRNFFRTLDLKSFFQGVVIIFVSMWGIGIYLITSSYEYSEAIRFIHSNAIIQNELGQIESTRLGLSKFRRRYVGVQGSASFVVVVKGASNSGDIQFEMKNDGSDWKIESCLIKKSDGTITKVK